MSDETPVLPDPPVDPKPRPLTCKEMGAMGGRTTSARYGTEHYQRLGKMAAKARWGDRIKPIPEGRGKRGRKGRAWAVPEEAMAGE